MSSEAQDKPETEETTEGAGEEKTDSIQEDTSEVIELSEEEELVYAPMEWVPLGVAAIVAKEIDAHDPFKASEQIKEESENISAEVAIVNYLKDTPENEIDREKAIAVVDISPEKFDLAVARLQHRDLVYKSTELGINKLLRLVTPALVIKTLLVNTLKIVKIENEMVALRGESKENKEKVTELNEQLIQTKKELAELRNSFEERGLIKKNSLSSKEEAAHLLGLENQEDPQSALLAELVWDVINETAEIKKTAQYVLAGLKDKETFSQELYEAKQKIQEFEESQHTLTNPDCVNSSELETKVAQLESDIKELQEELSKKAALVETLEGEKENAENSAQLHKDAIEQANNQIEELNKTISSKEEEKLELDAKLKNSQSAYDELSSRLSIAEQELASLKEIEQKYQALVEKNAKEESASATTPPEPVGTLDHETVISNPPLKSKKLKIFWFIFGGILLVLASLLVVGIFLNKTEEAPKNSSKSTTLEIAPVMPSETKEQKNVQNDYTPQGVSTQDILDIAQKHKNENTETTQNPSESLQEPAATTPPPLPRSQQLLPTPKEVKIELNATIPEFTTILKFDDLKKQEIVKARDGVVINGKKFKENDEVYGHKIIRINDTEVLFFSIATKTPSKIKF